MNAVTNTHEESDTQTIVARKFLLKHSFRAGAVIWVKDRKTNKDYYVVLRSHTRPAKGVQLPGGRVEKLENVANTVVREVKEETGLDTTILCPLGIIYINNPTKNYSRLETYYIVRPSKPLDIKARWKHIDKDRFKQKMEVWLKPVEDDASFLSSGQDLAVKMFRQWLNEHAELNSLKGIVNYKDAIQTEYITLPVENKQKLVDVFEEEDEQMISDKNTDNSRLEDKKPANDGNYKPNNRKNYHNKKSFYNRKRMYNNKKVVKSK
jgi:8-oxo-dGTP pyrophosphatase MutT (NUDIX family)